ncbi:hypothetical protein ACFQU7_42425 [Pseudoroseomonas wenyumeiae]
MTSIQLTPAGAALVAIDIAKLRNEVLIELPDEGARHGHPFASQVVQPFSVRQR